MINAEKHKDQLLKFVEENHDSLFGLDKNSEPINCAVSRCNNCQFGFKKNKYVEGYSCSAARMKWLLSEYREPIKLSEFEHSILEWIYNECYEYIAKDDNGDLYAYCSEPRRLENSWYCDDGGCDLTIFSKLFDFIKWEDAAPVNIDNLLSNCDVLKDEW